MDQQKIILEFQVIFKELFKIKKVDLSPSLELYEINDWSSLRHIMFIDAIEKKFNIKFRLNEIIELKSIGDICRMVEFKLSEK